MRCSCFIDHSYIPFVCTCFMCIYVYNYYIFTIHTYIYIIEIYTIRFYVLLCIYDTSIVCIDSLSMV